MGIIILKGVLTKFHFLMNFPHLEKFDDLIKDLKYEHQTIFSLWWRVKLKFRDRYRKTNIFSKNSNCYHVWCKKQSLPTQMDLCDPYMVFTLFPRGIIIFQGVLTKFNFSKTFPQKEKFVDFMKDLK